MANIMSSFKLHNQPSRNGFDLSNRHSFTAKIGELLPVQVKECLPGDKFKINLTHFSRTQPLTSPAYVRIKEYYDFCFVPTRLLWKYFDQFINQMPNNVSSDSLTSEQVTFSRHPFMLLSDIKGLLQHWDGDADEPYKDELGFDKSQTTVKLLELLGYGNVDQDPSSTFNIDPVNPFPLLAYQKIYNDIFRFDQWELPLPHCYNIDFINNGSNSLIDISSYLEGDQIDMFNMRYANYPKDLIMGVLPNSQFGDVSLVTTSSGLNNLVANGRNGNSSFTLRANATASESALATDGVVLNSKSNIDQFFNFSILALRQAEFLQKWKEVAQSAKQDYRDQIKAHWNVNVSKARSGLTEYLGGITSNVQIDGAINNNLTDGNTIIKGTAISGSRGEIDFEAPEHGILMCIYHAAPMLDYNGKYATDPFVFKTVPTDYAIPELDKTGMQLVPSAYLSNNPDHGQFPNYLGYAPRYIEYKTDVDKTFGAFNGSLSNWVAPFTPMESADPGTTLWTYLDFKVNSRIFDGVFAVNASSQVSTDQLLCNADFNIKCVRNLDVNGMPY